ncbi:MAG: hypothetical protein Kow0098_22150 [Ignavibacteriaceae bacterium]
MKEFFSVQEIASILKMSKSAVLYHIKNGKLKAVKVGSVYIIKQEDFGEFLKEHKASKKHKQTGQQTLGF